MTQQQLSIIISAKDMASNIMKQVGGSIDSLKNKTQALALQGLQAMNNGFQKTAEIIKTGMAVGIGGIATAFGLFVKNTADMQQTRAGFEGLTGSIQKTDDLMKQLVETAKKTPLQFADVAKNAENLLAFGIASDTVNDKLKMLGDVARGNSFKLGLLANVYGQVKEKGRLMGDDLLQFASQGIPLTSELAKQFGVSQLAIRDMVSEGKIGFKDVDKALQSLTSKGGLFYKAMENSSLTLNGVISNLTDTFFGFGRALLGMDETGNIKEGGIFWNLSKGAQILLDTVSKIDGEKIGQNLIKMVQPAWDFITSNTPAAQAVLIGLATVAGTLMVGAFGTMAVAVIAATWPFILLGLIVAGLYFSWSTNFLGMQDSTMQFWAVIQPILMGLWDLFMNWVWPSIQQMGKALMELWNVISPFIIPILQVLGVILGVILVGAILLVIGFIKLLAVAITDWANGFKSDIEKGQSAIKDFQKGFEMMGNIAKGVFRGIANGLIDAVNGIVNAWKNIARNVKDIPGIGIVADMVLRIPEIPKFESGGVVGGSSFTGDKILARVNSGELILNQNQQNSLLNGSGGGSTTLQFGDINITSYLGTEKDKRRVVDELMDAIEIALKKKKLI